MGSQDQSEGYVPQSGQIIGILKQLKDTMEKNLAEVNAAEEAAIKNFEALAADKQFLADLDKNCDTKKAEWAERSKTRSAELLALADTIKILNDDDALELFKKTLPSSSFLQTEVTMKEVRRRALRVMVQGRRAHGRRD